MCLLPNGMLRGEAKQWAKGCWRVSGKIKLEGAKTSVVWTLKIRIM
ncbi:Translation initiation factor IF-1 [Candidatus Hodgkinia cicadicola]|nr:Translation initiation factor IF-1 [Candidatus Hodgkinia cicadicola]